ncbi:GNAT family N-acetyltransferase [Desulfosporosinus sp. FKB]|uniref:GNAT family N-acetyltransferase n=1 Tax=Desulfosporosinus sp. FKB TaxID=1969835 RepID=UPI000B4A1F77|nr:GNAT family N-acetyltransferase [Desulfosporosinus sp. FKB]
MNDLQYEPLAEIHAEDLLSLWGDEDVICFTNIHAPCSLSEIQQRICRLAVFDVFVIRYKGELAGVIGCPCISKIKEEYGSFYHFKKTFWNRGIATQAIEWLLNYMQTKYTSAIFYADVIVDNVASEKILKHFGFHCTSVKEN